MSIGSIIPVYLHCDRDVLGGGLGHAGIHWQVDINSVTGKSIRVTFRKGVSRTMYFFMNKRNGIATSEEQFLKVEFDIPEHLVDAPDDPFGAAYENQHELQRGQPRCPRRGVDDPNQNISSSGDGSVENPDEVEMDQDSDPEGIGEDADTPFQRITVLFQNASGFNVLRWRLRELGEAKIIRSLVRTSKFRGRVTSDRGAAFFKLASRPTKFSVNLIACKEDHYGIPQLPGTIMHHLRFNL